MSTADISTSDATTSDAKVDLKLEVVIIPVSDVDRAKEFYARLGWRIDADIGGGEGIRLVQVTPPGSGCSVAFGIGVVRAAPGTALAELVVSDIDAARDELLGRGIERVEVFHGAPWARISGPDPERRSYRTYGSFTDPDGNEWLLQEVTTSPSDPAETGHRTFSSERDLAAALRRAEAAYGSRDEDRPDWYAAYLMAELRGEAPPAR
jgi:catechol 2,3-dioxygenase-like lactoylglutathione lyase family enzyme